MLVLPETDVWPAPQYLSVYAHSDGIEIEDGNTFEIKWTQQEALELAQRIISKYGSDHQRRALGLLERAAQ